MTYIELTHISSNNISKLWKSVAKTPKQLYAHFR